MKGVSAAVSWFLAAGWHWDGEHLFAILAALSCLVVHGWHVCLEAFPGRLAGRQL